MRAPPSSSNRDALCRCVTLAWCALCSCVMDPILLGTIQYDSSKPRAYAESHVYKYSDLSAIFFMCNIRICSTMHDDCAEETVGRLRRLVRRSLRTYASIAAAELQRARQASQQCARDREAENGRECSHRRRHADEVPVRQSIRQLSSGAAARRTVARRQCRTSHPIDGHSYASPGGARPYDDAYSAHRLAYHRHAPPTTCRARQHRSAHIAPRIYSKRIIVLMAAALASARNSDVAVTSDELSVFDLALSSTADDDGRMSVAIVICLCSHCAHSTVQKSAWH